MINVKDLKLIKLTFYRSEMYDDNWIQSKHHMEFIEVISDTGKPGYVKTPILEFVDQISDNKYMYLINVPYTNEIPLFDIIVNKFIPYKDIKFLGFTEESLAQLNTWYRSHLVKYLNFIELPPEELTNAKTQKNKDPLMGRYK